MALDVTAFSDKVVEKLKRRVLDGAIAVRGRYSVFLLALLFVGGPAQADDEARSALLAASCSGCHAAQPAERVTLPRLDVLTAEQIAASLRSFRDNGNATVMQRIAKGYSDYQIDLIANYIANIENQESP